MNIFNIHYRVIGEYSKYISSFLDIANPRIGAAVEDYFNTHKLWPRSLPQFNPLYELTELHPFFHYNIDYYLSKKKVIRNTISSETKRKLLEWPLKRNQKIYDKKKEAGLWTKKNLYHNNEVQLWK